MIKIFNKLGTKGMYLNIIKSIYDKPMANIALNSGETESSSSKIKNNTRMPTLVISI